MLEMGSLVKGKYKILSVIGKGGMSVVYLALDESENTYWAVKEVRKGGMQNSELVKQRLIVETSILKDLNHPNLPNIIDVVDTGKSFLIVMDYIEGIPLNQLLKKSGAQKEEDVIRWALQLCDVLLYLHSQNPPIIYRDMKPANVMLTPEGNVVLIDFGTAREYKATKMEDTACLGTRGYAAPEQYGGHGQTDARTDIYCLGTTLYHLLTGHNPARPPYEMYPIREKNPALSAGLEKIIQKCTEFYPEDRYQSCQELLRDLRQLDREGQFIIQKQNEKNKPDPGLIAEQKKKILAFLGLFALAAVFGIVGQFSRNDTISIACQIISIIALLISAAVFLALNIAESIDILLGDRQQSPGTGESRISPVRAEKADGNKPEKSAGNAVTEDLNEVPRPDRQPTQPARSFVVERSIIYIHTDEMV